ncbi:tetratricopeptide repeat protein [Polaribacter gochangensis]|uniref:tetratricopeptide repeat protein n=1 Tax=Polaribacter gochangensis TaxID=3252903 RepID=UPI003904D044
MNKKIVYFISLVFVIIIAVNIVSAVGVNIWALFKWQENDKIHESNLENQKYEDYFEPKIDSLIEIDPKNAIKYINKVIIKYPEIYFLELKKGIAYYKIDSMEIAIKQFRKSMSKSGHEFPTALGHIGWTLVELERYDEAIVEFKKAAKQNSVYILDIAQVYELRNDFVNAQKYYELRLGVLEKDNDPYYKNEIEELKIKIEKLKKKS